MSRRCAVDRRGRREQKARPTVEAIMNTPIQENAATPPEGLRTVAETPELRQSAWRRFLLPLLPVVFGLGGGLLFFRCPFAPYFEGLFAFTPGIVVGTVAVCAWTDYRRRKIYNAVTYPAFLWILASACAVFWISNDRLTAFVGVADFPEMLFGIAVCFGITLFPFLLMKGGAGDVKLAAVLGAGLTFGNALAVLLLAYVLAAVFRIAGLVVEIGPIALLKPFYHRIGSFFVPLWIPVPSPEEKEILAAPIPLAPFMLLSLFLVHCIPVRRFFLDLA